MNPKIKIFLGYTAIAPLILMAVGVVGFTLLRIFLETAIGFGVVAAIGLFLIGVKLLNDEGKV